MNHPDSMMRALTHKGRRLSNAYVMANASYHMFICHVPDATRLEAFRHALAYFWELLRR